MTYLVVVTANTLNQNLHFKFHTQQIWSLSLLRRRGTVNEIILFLVIMPLRNNLEISYTNFQYVCIYNQILGVYSNILEVVERHILQMG